jgi:thiol-disulfide isomerase/thioredoxin
MRILVLTLVMLSATVACASGEAAPAPAEPAAPAPAQSAAPAGAQPADLGKPAPDFTLTDTEGTSHTLSALKGKTVILEWFNPGCPFVKAAHGSGGVLQGMAQRVARADLVWLSINSGAPGKEGHGLDRNKAARGDFGMTNPVLLDESGTVGRAFGAARTPHLFIVDKAGLLVYRGGIDNAPMGTVDDDRPRPTGSNPGERVNYVDRALEDLGAGRPVGLRDTPAYGCTVKYET